MVSLVGHLLKLRLRSEGDIDDYFVRSQKPITRLSKAGEANMDILFNTLLINGCLATLSKLWRRRALNQPRHFQS